MSSVGMMNISLIILVVKYDDLIKNSRDLDNYFGYFGKILRSTTLIQSVIART